MVDKIRKRRLAWLRYVKRMEGKRLPLVALYRQVEGARSRGGWTKILMENVKEDLA